MVELRLSRKLSSGSLEQELLIIVIKKNVWGIFHEPSSVLCTLQGLAHLFPHQICEAGTTVILILQMKRNTVIP